MRSPSPRCFPNVVALYRFTGDQTTDLGLAPNPYTLISSGVTCSVQPDQPTRVFDGEVLKIAEKGLGALLFSTDPGLTINDKAVWVDTANVTRNLFITGVADQAGRGAMFELSYTERPA